MSRSNNEKNTSIMTDLEEGEISNEKIISQQIIISGDNISTKPSDNQATQNEEDSQGFFHKLKPVSANTEPKEINKEETTNTFLSRKRESSPPHYFKKPFVKRNLCQYYSKNGSCTKGNNCRFVHEDSYHQPTPQYTKHNYNTNDVVLNKNYKRDLCKYYLNGSCLKGDNCTFSHNLKDFPCKYYQIRGHCDNRDHCKFFHRKLSKDEMMKFIKDHEQFIIDIKDKYGKTMIDSYFTYYTENKTKILSGMNDYEHNNNSSSNRMMNPIMNQDWMNMSMNPTMFQINNQPQGMMMGFPPMYGNGIPNQGMPMPPVQFFPFPMNYGLGQSMPGHNQFLSQQYFQGQTNIGNNINLPQSYSFDQMTQNANKLNITNLTEDKNKEISTAPSDNLSRPKESLSTQKEGEEATEGEREGKAEQEPELETLLTVKEPQAKKNNPTEQLFLKVANAIKKTNPVDPRLQK